MRPDTLSEAKMYVIHIEDFSRTYQYGAYMFGDTFIRPVDIVRLYMRAQYNNVTISPLLWPLDTVLIHYVMKELKFSSVYRRSFIRYNTVVGKIRFNWFTFQMVPTSSDLIDYNWNERVNVMLRERLELNHMFSWLSTLGGAFSALGDYSVNCAVTAGKISVNQFKLALRLGDPGIQARCRLYFALSLIQRKYFKYARHIIQDEYQKAQSDMTVDKRLLNMCKGIWSKLQYDHATARRKRMKL